MKIDMEKLEIAKARACFNTGDMLRAANIPWGTYSNILNKKTASPKTVGKLAKALGADVLDIIKQPTEKQDE